MADQHGPQDTIIADERRRDSTAAGVAPADPAIEPVGTSAARHKPALVHAHDARRANVWAVMPPPITAASLAQLDCANVVKSLQLCHDLVHDPHLKFRPDTTLRRSDYAYWRLIHRELCTYLAWEAGPAPRRLRFLLSEICDIVAGLELNPATAMMSMHFVSSQPLLARMDLHGPVILLDWVSGLLDFLDASLGSCYPSSREHCQALRAAVARLSTDERSSRHRASAACRCLRRLLYLLEHIKLAIVNWYIVQNRDALTRNQKDAERRAFQTCVALHGAECLYPGGLVVSRDGNEPRARAHTVLKSALAFMDKNTALPHTWALDTARMGRRRKMLHHVASIMTLSLYAHVDVAAVRQFIHAVSSIVVNPDESADETDISRQWRNSAEHVAAYVVSMTPVSGRSISDVRAWIDKNICDALEGNTAQARIFCLFKSRILAMLDATTMKQLLEPNAYGSATQAAASPASEYHVAGSLPAFDEIVRTFAISFSRVVLFHWSVFAAFYVAWAGPHERDHPVS